MKCKICSNVNVEELQAGDKAYYHCQNCELIFIDDSGIIEPEDEKRVYQQHNNTPENEGYVQMFERFIKQVVEPYARKIKTVLEFGCGPGPVLAKLLTKRGFLVDKYDPYFFPEKVFQGKEYDLITSTEVFEHFKDPHVELKRILRHLKQDGYLAIMTSFHPGKSKFADWWYHRDPTHIAFYNENTFKEISNIFQIKIIAEDRDKYCLFKK